MIRVYTQGSFDLLHEGHIKLLKRCKAITQEEGEVVVSLLSDAAYEKYRGYKPTDDYEKRRRALLYSKLVDRVIEGDNERTKNELEIYDPHFVVVGSDWAKKDIYKQYKLDQQWLDDHNILLVYFPYTEGISSTKLKNEKART